MLAAKEKYSVDYQALKYSLIAQRAASAADKSADW
jgi:hypothetical protein